MSRRTQTRLQKTGTFGDVSTFSFFHHIATMEGGMVLTDDEELHHLLCHGWTWIFPDRPGFEPKNDDFNEFYRFILPGYNVPTSSGDWSCVAKITRYDDRSTGI